MKKLLIACSFLLICLASNAQVETVHLFSKGLSTTGFGLFLHPGFAVGSGNEISTEFAFDYFQSGERHIALAPLLVGFRHSLDGSGAGWYLEPLVGYSFGGTDIPKTDAAGNPVLNDGVEVDQKVTGFTAAMGIGYIIPSAVLPLNFGLRYGHIFVPSGDPSQNMISLRVSYSLAIGKKYAARTGQTH
ncbi:MAG TPA: hypothetical protein VHD83_04485 [Puia sp.]|nr:hypothetical protein [Puia sp.]